ncbi:hypothetical protein SADUNF_Sadunf09G0120100 [Salix dunnii]|uniref:Uncharacterized protein n=1 Tax=Salix dunnii TaxID=1413687 RepID=A0A835JX17_9ROSI|nr:hypothetical protein SADUNF_Sadunf09G0120100 [Salix dunnii]
MANWVSAGRSTSNIIRATLRATKKSASPGASVSVTPFSSIRLPNLTLRCHSRISSSRLVRRELSSLLPVHSAIASACLVSKLPSELSTSSEGEILSLLFCCEEWLKNNLSITHKLLFKYEFASTGPGNLVDLLIISAPSSASACSSNE